MMGWAPLFMRLLARMVCHAPSLGTLTPAPPYSETFGLTPLARWA